MNRTVSVLRFNMTANLYRPETPDQLYFSRAVPQGGLAIGYSYLSRRPLKLVNRRQSRPSSRSCEHSRAAWRAGARLSSVGPVVHVVGQYRANWRPLTIDSGW